MKDVSNMPVLLVDDDTQVLHSASIVLRSSGLVHVLTVDDSRSVMPLLAERDIGALLLDLMMPHYPGMRSWSKSPKIIRIFRSLL